MCVRACMHVCACVCVCVRVCGCKLPASPAQSPLVRCQPFSQPMSGASPQPPLPPPPPPPPPPPLLPPLLPPPSSCSLPARTWRHKAVCSVEDDPVCVCVCVCVCEEGRRRKKRHTYKGVLEEGGHLISPPEAQTCRALSQRLPHTRTETGEVAGLPLSHGSASTVAMIGVPGVKGLGGWGLPCTEHHAPVLGGVAKWVWPALGCYRTPHTSPAVTRCVDTCTPSRLEDST